jgi:hypothetical protein
MKSQNHNVDLVMDSASPVKDDAGQEPTTFEDTSVQCTHVIQQRELEMVDEDLEDPKDGRCAKQQDDEREANHNRWGHRA